MRIRFTLSLMLLLMIIVVEKSQAQFTLTTGGAICASTTNQFFDQTAYKCDTCDSFYSGAGWERNDQNCTCGEGFRQIISTVGDGSAYTCTGCGTNEAVSRDRSTCMACPATAAYDTTTRDCVACPTNERLTERTATGVLLTNKTCTTCGPNSLGSTTNKYGCVACPDSRMEVVGGLCTCPTGYTLFSGKVCIQNTRYNDFLAQYSNEALTTIAYNYVTDENGLVSTKTVTSSFRMNELLLPNAVACSLASSTNHAACQAVANLCVAQLYDTNSVPCQIYKSLWERASTTSLNGWEGWNQDFPWIYHATPGSDTTQTSFLESSPLTLDYSFGTRLQLKLLSYTLNGTFLGLDYVTNELTLCDGQDVELTKWMEVGVGKTIACNLNLYQFYSKPLPQVYSLFIEDASGALYPIPVEITNLGSTTLYRSFMTYDNAFSTISSTGRPTIARYLSHADLSFELQANAPSKIRIPTLKLTYEDRDISALTSAPDPNYHTTELTTVFSPYVSFESNYFMNYTTHWITLGILSGIFVVIAIILTIVQMVFFVLSRDSFLVDVEFILKFINRVCDNVGNAIFFAVVCMCMYWYWLFKHAVTISVIPPARGTDLIPYGVFVGIAWLFKAIDLGICIGRQLLHQVFFIDWEKPIVGRLREQNIIRRRRQAKDGENEESRAKNVQQKRSTSRKRRRRGGRRTSEPKEENEPVEEPPTPDTRRPSTQSDSSSKNEEDEDKNRDFTNPIRSYYSSWRLISAAREYLSLYPTRIVNFDVTFLLLVMIMYGGRLTYLGNQTHDHTNLSHDVSENPILQFWALAQFWILLYVLQYLLNVFLIFPFWYDPVRAFIKRVGESNISVFALLDHSQGYYVHGAIGESADVNLGNLHKDILHVKEKPDDKVLARSILGKSIKYAEQKKCFEMFLTRETRSLYDDEAHIAKTKKKETTSSSSSRFTNLMGPSARLHHFIMPRTQHTPMEMLDTARIKLNAALKMVIKKIRDSYAGAPSDTPLKDPIHDQLVSNRFGIPPFIRTLKADTLVYDRSLRFSNMFIRGLDIKFFIFNLLSYALLELAIPVTFVPLVVVWVMNKLIVFVATYLFRINLIQKSFIYERFL